MPHGVIAIVIGSLVFEKPNVFLFAFRKLGAQRQIRLCMYMLFKHLASLYFMHWIFAINVLYNA